MNLISVKLCIIVTSFKHAILTVLLSLCGLGCKWKLTFLILFKNSAVFFQGLVAFSYSQLIMKGGLYQQNSITCIFLCCFFYIKYFDTLLKAREVKHKIKYKARYLGLKAYCVICWVRMT